MDHLVHPDGLPLDPLPYHRVHVLRLVGDKVGSIRPSLPAELGGPEGHVSLHVLGEVLVEVVGEGGGPDRLPPGQVLFILLPRLGGEEDPAQKMSKGGAREVQKRRGAEGRQDRRGESREETLLVFILVEVLVLLGASSARHSPEENC